MSRLALIASLVVLLTPVPGMSVAEPDGRLADAAMKRDTAAVRTLLQQKVDVNAAGKDGTPALHWLVRVDDRCARRRHRRGPGASRSRGQSRYPGSCVSTDGPDGGGKGKPSRSGPASHRTRRKC